MLNTLISHKGQTAILTLPMDRFNLQYELAQSGIRRRLTDIPISDEEEQDVQVKLYSDSDVGNSLAVLFNASHSLEDANLCAHMVENTRPELREEIEQNIIYGQYHSPKAVMEDIKTMTDELIGVTVNYYCPLKFQMSDAEYGDWYEVDNGYGVANEDAIRELLQKEQDSDMNNMADYFHGSESAKAKLISAIWDVENVNGELFGVIRTGLREAFSPAEEQEWIDELTGQAADGFGEGLEQREINTEDGDLYVSFWNSGDVDLCQYFGHKFRFLFIPATIDNPNINALGFSPEGKTQSKLFITFVLDNYSIYLLAHQWQALWVASIPSG